MPLFPGYSAELQAAVGNLAEARLHRVPTQRQPAVTGLRHGRLTSPWGDEWTTVTGESEDRKNRERHGGGLHVSRTA